MKHFVIFTIIGIIIIMGCGCSGGKKLAAPNYDLTGTWTGDMTGGRARSFIITVTQIKNDLTGMMTNNLMMTFSVNGITWENDMSLTAIDVDFPDYKAKLVGTTLDGITASGTWSDNDMNSGNWTASKL